MNVAALSALWRTTGIKVGSSDDLSRTVDDGHTLPHVILRLKLVNFSFSECASSPEKRRLTSGMCRRVSRIRLRPQCVLKNIFVLRYSQDAQPCCRFKARLSVNDPSQWCLRSLRSRVASTLVHGVLLRDPLLGTLFYERRPDQPSSSSLARRVCVQSSTSSSIPASRIHSRTP